MPNLTVFLAGQVIREVALTQTWTRLGRHPANDIVLDDLSISGEHAVFRLQDGQVHLEDRHSTNGSFVNGQRIRQGPLEPGDHIRMGIYCLALDHASVRVLSGAAAGREVPILKPLTTLGASGKAVAGIGRQARGYAIALIDRRRSLTVNGIPLGPQAKRLHHGDLIEMAGAQMEFLQP